MKERYQRIVNYIPNILPKHYYNKALLFDTSMSMLEFCLKDLSKIDQLNNMINYYNSLVTSTKYNISKRQNKYDNIQKKYFNTPSKGFKISLNGLGYRPILISLEQFLHDDINLVEYFIHVLFHEFGHVNLKSNNETIADIFAHEYTQRHKRKLLSL